MNKDYYNIAHHNEYTNTLARLHTGQNITKHIYIDDLIA